MMLKIIQYSRHFVTNSLHLNSYQSILSTAKCFDLQNLASNHQQWRNSSSFFTRNSGEQIWKGLLSVSNAGRRRGRGRGANRKMFKDLNRGQIMGSEIVQIKELKADPAYKENLIKIRDQMEKRKRAYVHPLERGWSGTKLLGKWIGPPDPIAGEEFLGFDTRLLVVRPVFYMKPNFGRTKTISVLAVTGNGNGLVGYAVAKSEDLRTAISNAKNKAGQRLFRVELDHDTILHDFYSRFGSTKVFVEKKPPGYGLSAHRCLRSICDVIGIKDIHCKVEGSERNYLNLTRAFLLGLINQKTFQQMADEKRLNVVEINESFSNYPILKAKPSDNLGGCRTDEQIGDTEILDFDIFIHDGKVKEQQNLKPMYYTKEKGWRNYMKKWNYRKSREQVRINLMARYNGQLESYITIREKERLMAKRQKFLATQNQ
ncbi:28s ribosomal protein s5 [Dermatophagoides farinae]|uniref:Small ribosomal subunit protein uS5m n=1 Tax=Dermatophagoides farinae TaxID=6954 RepID=A0A9D4P8W7_DERFA|nr:28s ribosomal protein s5 [Dermatophagoides farinae]